MSKFNIDFFEFSFLVEACIPPRPIARAMFFQRVSNSYYHEMTDNERKNLFSWIIKLDKFDINDNNCQNFYNRFNPDNQYKIHTDYGGKKEIKEVYLHNEKYHIDDQISVIEEYITKIEKL